MAPNRKNQINQERERKYQRFFELGGSMASLKLKRQKYYAVISYKNEGKFKQKLIPLYYSQEARAKMALIEINKQEQLYKNGQITLDQISSKKPPKTVLSEHEIYYQKWDKIFNDFYKYKRTMGISEKTIDIYELAFKSLKKIFKNKTYKEINVTDKEMFYSQLKGFYENINTFNMRIRAIRTLFFWLLEEEKIQKLPFKFKQLPQKIKNPAYFSDREVVKILLAAKAESEFLFARIFVHWQTGLRLSEFHRSYLKGDFLVISDAIKHGNPRSIPVKKKVKRLYIVAKSLKILDKTLSRKFHGITDDLKISIAESGQKRSFHSLRDTFACRMYYKTKDIYKVKVLLGHSSVTTTEIYANFDLKLLKHDFTIAKIEK